MSLSPAASVALYSLGDEALLAAATDEVVGLLDRLGILGQDRHLLDIGCGIGRFEQALSPLAGFVTGIDISPGMIEAARTRCAGLPNVRHHHFGPRLRPIPAGQLRCRHRDRLVSYLYEAGDPELVRTQLREIDRVLRAPGDLNDVNLSYRGDLALDRSDAGAFSDELGFKLLRDGTSDLRSWDGTTFHFRKPA